MGAKAQFLQWLEELEYQLLGLTEEETIEEMLRQEQRKEATA